MPGDARRVGLVTDLVSHVTSPSPIPLGGGGVRVLLKWRAARARILLGTPRLATVRRGLVERARAESVTWASAPCPGAPHLEPNRRWGIAKIFERTYLV
jgi:hypothetical protein